VAELELTQTDRGFLRAEWKDTFLTACSIQESSNADERRLLLGVEMAGGRGQMHLNREMVAALLPLLHRFVTTGYLMAPEPPPDDRRLDRYGVPISPWHVVVTERAGTSRTVALDDLDAVHQMVTTQLDDPRVAGLAIQPNPLGAEDLAAVLVELLEHAPAGPVAARAAAVLTAYDLERE
jgi:hypothetical protein